MAVTSQWFRDQMRMRHVISTHLEQPDVLLLLAAGLGARDRERAHELARARARRLEARLGADRLDEPRLELGRAVRAAELQLLDELADHVDRLVAREDLERAERRAVVGGDGLAVDERAIARARAAKTVQRAEVAHDRRDVRRRQAVRVAERVRGVGRLVAVEDLASTTHVDGYTPSWL